jgi:hypothetical protein
MNGRHVLLTACAAAAVACIASLPLVAQEKPKIKIPDAGVPQIMTLEGLFVRAAYNNEGYVILGYRTANLSVGDEWLLLDVGMTVREGVPAVTLHRAAVSLDTPGGQTIALPSVEEFRKADLRALNNRANVARDSINYFPPMASRPCRIGFFSEVEQRAMSWDDVELSDQRACLGRIYFHVPGGIQYGQHWLNVKFEKTLIRVPFRILTKEEEKIASKNYKDIRKQVQEAFSPKKKDKGKEQ